MRVCEVAEWNARFYHIIAYRSDVPKVDEALRVLIERNEYNDNR